MTTDLPQRTNAAKKFSFGITDYAADYGDTLLNPESNRRLPVVPLPSSAWPIARFIVPGLPHHVTQRGNRRERVFTPTTTMPAAALYHGLLASQCRKQGVACWAYCWMPNDV